MSFPRKKAFRVAYGKLSILRSLLKPGTPGLALTATVERKRCVHLIKLLGMQVPETVDVSINNDIRFSVQKIKKGLQCFNWLVDKIATNSRVLQKQLFFAEA